MDRFIGILEKEPGTLWGVYFPDVPGCVAAAETAELALAYAAEALKDVVEDMTAMGEDLPRSRTIEDLKADAEVAEALAAGAALVVVPFSLERTAEAESAA